MIIYEKFKKEKKGINYMTTGVNGSTYIIYEKHIKIYI